MPPTTKSAFTLVELLVVVAIIVVLISILLPSLEQSFVYARRAVCLSNQHQLHVASFTYAHDFQTRLPWRTVGKSSFDTSEWAWYENNAYSHDDRRVWLGYISGYSIENGHGILQCPEMKGAPTLSGTDPPNGTKSNQGWGFTWYNITFHVSSYNYYSSYVGNTRDSDLINPQWGYSSTANARSSYPLFSDTVRRDGANQHTGNHGEGSPVLHVSTKVPAGAGGVYVNGAAVWSEFTGYDDNSSDNGLTKYNVSWHATAGMWWPKP